MARDSVTSLADPDLFSSISQTLLSSAELMLTCTQGHGHGHGPGHRHSHRQGHGHGRFNSPTNPDE
jgi:hypothetical protein